MKLFFPEDQSGFMVQDDEGNDITSLFHGMVKSVAIEVVPCQPNRVVFEMVHTGDLNVEVLKQHATVVLQLSPDDSARLRQEAKDKLREVLSLCGVPEPSTKMVFCSSCKGSGQIAYGGALNPRFNACEVCNGLGLVDLVDSK